MAHAASASLPELEKPNGKVAFHFSDGEVFHAIPKMSDEEFDEFCFANRDLRIEQDTYGNIIIMPPSSYESGLHEVDPIIDLGLWNRHTKLGKVFSPSTLFKLPDGSKRMPDAAWVSLEKHNGLSEKERKSFAHIVPDFVIEVRSPSDRLKTLQAKMQDAWIANGVRLAWLIDPETQQAWIYRADGSELHIRDFQQVLSGEDLLPGFEFDLKVLGS